MSVTATLAEWAESIAQGKLTGPSAWNAVRPQVLVILNGHVTQGLDINYRQVQLEPDTDYDMDLYFYCGMENKKVQFLPSLVWLDEKVEKLYYDLKVTLDEAGFITSLFDKKAGRQVVQPGARLNELQAFEDFPKEYDAWEITN